LSSTLLDSAILHSRATQRGVECQANGNGARKPNGNGRAKPFFGSTNDRRTEIEAKFVRDLIAEGVPPIAAVRRLAEIIAPGPWSRKPGPRTNGQ
jgi:hypothetical protein